MTGRLWLGLLVICVAAGKAESARKAVCADLEIWQCNTNMNLVCASNGLTYGNECLLCKEIHESKKNILVKRQGAC
ncbi:serine protease inhibitor Kazal-type 1-like [Poeciliopsis prolifica]|uniref:serine protease inhibitor Kazal-type 1-like n=1 Tax=Poeciliopsis prolifica TaxID=188132 RepID=UPI00241326AD|nr:serine protease inhibitor Kazal-type 1-like [Poeciliopsis prolifica]